MPWIEAEKMGLMPMLRLRVLPIVVPFLEISLGADNDMDEDVSRPLPHSCGICDPYLRFLPLRKHR